MDAKLKTSFVRNLNNKNNIGKLNIIRETPINFDINLSSVILFLNTLY